MSDDDENCDCPAGAPGWLATFADLMSLLMCFFVLLLSFANMEVPKFKQAAGSLKEAFGVQRIVVADVIPMGNSSVQTEFSPGKPELVQFDTVSQQFEINVPTPQEFEQKKEEEEQKIAEEKAEILKSQLAEDIQKGSLEVERKGKEVVLRINEKASFDSGSAEYKQEFAPSLKRIIASLKDVKGQITVTGHTDDIPIRNDKYRSNWDLSASRAASVAMVLERFGKIDKKRLEVRGYADTVPLAKNDSTENRSKNRRVEILIGADSREIIDGLVRDGYISNK